MSSRMLGHNNSVGRQFTIKHKELFQNTLSMQLRRSASLKRGGGRVTPESSVNDVGINCTRKFNFF
jgi:hypothetical protein